MPILVRDVTDLPVGAQLPCGLLGVGMLTVLDSYFEPEADGFAAYVEVDVTCDPDANIWDLDAFAKALNAEPAWWLSNTPQRRYRLHYRATATVPTVEDEAGVRRGR